jgi:hypothetical protein
MGVENGVYTPDADGAFGVPQGRSFKDKGIALCVESLV